MATHELSPRENEIVELAAEGLTNEAIADRLGLSLGTVNTYWLRIKVKVGGLGRTDTVLNIFLKRAARTLSEERIDWEGLTAILAKRRDLDVVASKERDLELRSALALLQLAIDSTESTAWTTNKDLTIQVIANGEFPSLHTGVQWEIGKTVYEIFKTTDPNDLAVAAHLKSLAGTESRVTLEGDFKGMQLYVTPFANEAGEVIGCISILNFAGK